MCKIITHRGPDEQGTIVKDRAALGMRRLSIIDLKTGQQPIFDCSGNLAIVFNGEIYNFQTLKKDLESRGHRFKTNSDTGNNCSSLRRIRRGLCQASARNVRLCDL